MRQSIILMLSMAALASAAPAAGQRGGPTCRVSAYLENEAPLNVRAGPSANARRLSVRHQGSPVADITGQSGGWFRVSRITDFEDSSILFSGTGWMRAATLGAGIANADPWIYARPSRQSRRVARLVPDQSVVTLLGCTGDWLQVREGNRTGWLSRGGQCGNPLTTCP